MASAIAVSTDYAPFPSLASRDALQARLEIPLLDLALGLGRRQRVLEVGCGGGNALAVVARRCQPSRLVGLDVDDALLERALRRLKAEGVSAELLRADVRHMPFADGSFDLVLDFGTCYHIARPAAALAEIARVLSPGGVFVEEGRLAQLIAHPLRSFGRSLPWADVPALVPSRDALLWCSRSVRP